MNAILIDCLGFEKHIELTDDTKTVEIPTSIDIPNYTFIKHLFIFPVPYYIFEREGDSNIFRMKPVKPREPIYWVNELKKE